MKNTKPVVKKECKRKLSGDSGAASQRKSPRLTKTEDTENMSEPGLPFTESENTLGTLTLEDGEEEEPLPDIIQTNSSVQPIVIHSPVEEVASQLPYCVELGDTPPVFRKLPKVNCLEKIALCIDLSKEMEEARFTLGNGLSYSGIQMVKRTLEIFIQTKHAMDSRHQFALIILTDSVVWITDFTNNAKEICDVLKDLNETSECDSCDLTSLLTTILEKTDLPEVNEPEVDPPPFVIRAVVIYGRAQTVPNIDEESEQFKKLNGCEYFFMDFLYIHPLASDDNNVQAIYDKLCSLDPTESSYVLELAYKPTKMHNKVASLLGHPLQRPAQCIAHYKIQQV